MVFKKSDIIVHAAMLFLVCFANAASKSTDAQNETIAKNTELEYNINDDIENQTAFMPIEELPFISDADIRPISISNSSALPKIILP